MELSMEMKIPQPIAAFIRATNHHNTDAFLAALTDTAVITDEEQDYRGIAAIKEWSDEKYIGAKVTFLQGRRINHDCSCSNEVQNGLEINVPKFL